MRKRLKNFGRFMWAYKQLAIVFAAFTLGGVLDLGGYDASSHVILIVASLFVSVLLIVDMVRDLRHGTYGLDILALVAILSAVLLKQYWAAIVVALMVTSGEVLEDYAEGQATKELKTLLANKPRHAHLVKGTKNLDILASAVKVGDKIKILPGEVVPVDCVIIEGVSSFDESSLTGESLPISRTTGDQLLSGSINVEGAIVAQAINTQSDSQYEQIIRLVKAASIKQSPFVRLADRYSIPFTLTAFIIAGSVWAISGDPVRFLEVIVVATPCPLLVGAPIALISGMSRSAREGVIVKSGLSLEKLAQIKSIAFDKTGTLTYGRPELKAIKTFGNFTKNEVLQFAAALEKSPNHILGSTIVAAAEKDQKVKPAKQVKEISGMGLEGRLKAKTIWVGRRTFLEQRGVYLPNSSPTEATATYIAVDGKLVGLITFDDAIRADSKSTLIELKKQGIDNVLMVTGDNEHVARSVAKQLGISKVFADCLPGNKIEAIESVKDRPIGFVGDGVNDAPVLTAADVGIALGARGSTAASESADVVIMTDDISKVATGIQIAKRTFRIAQQSILFGILISVGLMGVFATGKFDPVIGATVQEVVDVLVIFNALRAH